MTNAEKFLKDGVDIKQMATEMVDYFNFPAYEGIGEGSIEEFFGKEAKPTLTEDERAFLSLLPFMFEKVGKDKLGCLYITYHKEDDRYQYSLMPFNHLFQFIKERRRIFDRGLIRR